MSEPVKQNAPAASFIESDELKQAVSTAVAEILAKAEQGRKNSGDTSPRGDSSSAEALALAIAELTQQGTGQAKAVPPHVLRAREKARGEMVDAIERAHNAIRPALYQLKNKVYLAEILVEPFFVAADKTAHPTEIEWPGVPNEAMVPVNDVAKEIHGYFLASIANAERPNFEKPLGITPKGLVVNGRAVQSRRSISAPQELGDGTSADGLKIIHRGPAANYKETNILGTVAEPARQTAWGAQRP